MTILWPFFRYFLSMNELQVTHFDPGIYFFENMIFSFVKIEIVKIGECDLKLRYNSKRLLTSGPILRYQFSYWLALLSTYLKWWHGADLKLALWAMGNTEKGAKHKLRIINKNDFLKCHLEKITNCTLYNVLLHFNAQHSAAHNPLWFLRGSYKKVIVSKGNNSWVEWNINDVAVF